MHNTQPGQLYTEALGVARAIAYKSIIDRKIKSENSIKECLGIYQKIVGLFFSFLCTRNITIGFNEVLGSQP